MDKSLIFTNQVGSAIDTLVERLAPAQVYVLVDVNTASFVLPRLKEESQAVGAAQVIQVRAGEQFKNVESLQSIWKQLGNSGATRSALLINVGGGVVTDMGAFAAATFKRGIAFINVPTTLLGAVDASVGGKTGINFNSLKNEVGVIRQAEYVVVSTTFFRTLNTCDMLSGYAEMVKHAMLSAKAMTDELLAYDIADYDPDTLLALLERNVEVKCRYVASDLHDRGVRHALNLGHTFGHAFEMLALERKSPIPHGYAVAFGLLVALVASRMKCNFPSDELHRYAAFVAERYGVFEFSCDDYPHLLQLMHHDKKNTTTTAGINCVLLADYGHPQIDVALTDNDVTAALDIYRDLLHMP